MELKRGFTLVEILVVICIIAVLLGILIPVVNAIKNHTSGEQHVSIPTAVATPKTPEIPVEKSGDFQYYIHIDGHKYMIVLKDIHKPEIFNND